MSGLLFLTSDDFQLQKGIKGNIMITNIPGFSLILFYSMQCNHCLQLIPIFKQLPGRIGGCQFGMINVSQNKNCIILSRNTISPIDVVPYIILFINGKPYMRYQGPHNEQEISRFIVEISQNLQAKNKDFKIPQNSINQQTQFHNQNHIHNNNNNSNQNKNQNNPNQNKKYNSLKNNIPAYTIGHPLCGEGDEDCYLEFNKAYNDIGIDPRILQKQKQYQLPHASGMGQ